MRISAKRNPPIKLKTVSIVACLTMIFFLLAQGKHTTCENFKILALTVHEMVSGGQTTDPQQHVFFHPFEIRTHDLLGGRKLEPICIERPLACFYYKNRTTLYEKHIKYSTGKWRMRE